MIVCGCVCTHRRIGTIQEPDARGPDHGRTGLFSPTREKNKQMFVAVVLVVVVVIVEIGTPRTNHSGYVNVSPPFFSRFFFFCCNCQQVEMNELFLFFFFPFC